MSSHNHWIIFGPLFLAIAILAGCQDDLVAGIDGGDAPIPVAASASAGAITGIGSIVVNGKVFDTASAAITIDGEPGTEADLQIGQIVVVEYDPNNSALVADRISSFDSVQARIDAVDPTTFDVSILGQIVEVSDDTIFSGANLADSTALVPGMVVEVSGYALSGGEVSATRIEEQFDSDSFEVTGVVQALDSNARTFRINSLTVDYSNATLTGFDPDIADGDTVEVKGDQVDDAGVAQANSVELESDQFDDSFESIEVEGLITRFASATDFDVQGVTVSTTASTRYENGAQSDLGLNVKVEVEGSMDATGLLVADEIEFRAVSDAKVMAFVSAVDANQPMLQVLGIDIDETALTTYKDEGPLELREFSLSDINVGDYLEVIGQENVDRLSASFIKRKSSEDELKLKATASGFNQPDFVVLGVTVVTNGNTSFEDENEMSIDAATFFAIADGRVVEVKGNDVAGTFVADEVEIKD